MIPFDLMLKMSLLLSHILFQTGAFSTSRASITELLLTRSNEPGTCPSSQCLIIQDQATKGSLFQHSESFHHTD